MTAILFVLTYLLVPNCHFTSAITPQVTDTVVWGGASFRIRQLPFESAIETNEAIAKSLKSKSTNSHRGYVAEWLVSDGILYLGKLNDVSNRNKKEILESLGAVRFPVKAEWYSGTMHLPVGEFNDASSTWPIVIELSVDKGNVIATKVLKDAPDVDLTDRSR